MRTVQTIGDRRSQGRQAVCGGVAMMSVLQRLDPGLDDVLGRAKTTNADSGPSRENYVHLSF
jgi:hypothetical protein